MDDNSQQQTTSILELLYLIRSKNKGDLSFADWLVEASQWAEAVIAEYETGQTDTGIVNEDKRSG